MVAKVTIECDGCGEPAAGRRFIDVCPAHDNEETVAMVRNLLREALSQREAVVIRPATPEKRPAARRSRTRRSRKKAAAKTVAARKPAKTTSPNGQVTDEGLLEVIRAEPGLAPHVYAARLGVTRGSVLYHGANLRRQGLIVTEGNTQNKRWHLPAAA